MNNRLHRIRAGFFAVLAFSLPAFGERYYAHSPEIAELERLYRVSGLLFPFDAFPAPGAEVAAAARKLEARAAGPAAEAAGSLAEALEAREAGPRLDLDAGAAYEHRLYANPLSLEPAGMDAAGMDAAGMDAAASTRGADFRRSFLSRPPLLSLDFSGAGPLGFQAAMRAEVQGEWSGDPAAPNNLPSLGPKGAEVGIENHFFTRGALYWASSGVRASFGRDEQRWAPRTGSSLFPTEAVPYLDAFRFRAPFGPVALDWTIAGIHPRKNTVRDVEPNALEKDPLPADREGPFGFEGDPTTSAVWYVSHRFTWGAERFSVSLGEQVVYVRKNNFAMPTDFIPLLSWHNADVLPNNMCLVAQVRALPLPGLELSAEAGFDDVSAEAFGIGDYAIPTIDAYIGRAAYSFDAGGIALDLRGELGRTHYLWGNFDASRTGIESGYTIPLARAVYRYAMDGKGKTALLPLTSPYGPGADWAELSVAASRGGARAELGWRVLSLNTRADLVDTVYAKDDSVRDAPRSVAHEISARAEYALALGGGATASFAAAPSLVVKDGAVGFELALSARIRAAAVLFK